MFDPWTNTNILYVNSQVEKMNYQFVYRNHQGSYNFAMENRLKIIRKTLGLTQQELADLADTSLRNVQFLESGERQLTPKWMEIFSQVLDIEPWMFWVDPKSMASDEDHKMISHYHAAPAATRRKVDDLLFKTEKTEKGKK